MGHLSGEGADVFQAVHRAKVVFTDGRVCGGLTSSSFGGAAKRYHTLCDQVAAFFDTLCDVVE